MDIVDPRTGIEVRVRDASGYWTEIGAARTCDHPLTEVRCWTQRNGSTAAKAQCLACGAGVGNPLGGMDRSRLPKADDGLKASWEADVKAREDAIKIKYIDAAGAQSAEWWAKYDAHLQTPEWRRRRDLVFSRCGGVCEGCGEAEATEAHHMTYDHVFEEFLFELKGLCHACHVRWHDSERDA